MPYAAIVEQAAARQFGIRSVRRAVVGVRMDGDAAARGEFAEYFDVFGLHELDEVFHDDVDAVFMKVAVVAKAEQIEFQRFAFDHFFRGQVGYADGGKIRLAGDGAKAGEFRAVEGDPVVVIRVFVGEGFEDAGGVGLRVVRVFVAEQGKIG